VGLDEALKFDRVHNLEPKDQARFPSVGFEHNVIAPLSANGCLDTEANSRQPSHPI
jgi:hypothetical protein